MNWANLGRPLSQSLGGATLDLAAHWVGSWARRDYSLNSAAYLAAGRPPFFIGGSRPFSKAATAARPVRSPPAVRLLPGGGAAGRRANTRMPAGLSIVGI